MTGRTLGGRYEILEAIDEGCMAYVYRALCHKSNKNVAVKVLKDKFSNSAEYINRFKKEAEAAFSLEHENIVHVSDIGCDDGTYYIVMDLVEGKTLKTIINEDKILPESESILYAIQICSALSAAHKKGIIHRDIKPHNILVDKEKNAKITDFGIAKSLSATHEEEKEVIGSVYYVSPEQARGDNVDARTDIYSLGIMLYEMLTGELPYTGDQTVSVALKHINEQITAPIRKNPALSQSINNIILKATCKNRKDRYRSMEALREDLVRALVDPSGDFIDLPAGIYIGEGPSQASLSKHKLWKICVLVALIAGLVGAVVVGISLFQNDSSQKITVPDFADQGIDAATQTLTSLGLNASIAYDMSEKIPAGHIITQVPQASSLLNSGDTVTLTISSGPPSLLMPNLTGMSAEEAQELIEQMNLKIDSVTYELRNDMQPGLVISHIPEVESDVAAGDAVSLVVSTDVLQDQTAMPMVMDIQIDQAVTLLNENGFTNCFVYESDSELAEGTVIDQSPAQGIPTRFGDEVNLWVSRYLQKNYYGIFFGQIEIKDKESKVKIVLNSVQNGVNINYVVTETLASQTGKLPISQQIQCQTGGAKTVKVYVNNVEVLSKEVEFVRRVNGS